MIYKDLRQLKITDKIKNIYPPDWVVSLNPAFPPIEGYAFLHRSSILDSFMVYHLEIAPEFHPTELHYVDTYR